MWKIVTPGLTSVSCKSRLAQAFWRRYTSHLNFILQQGCRSNPQVNAITPVITDVPEANCATDVVCYVTRCAGVTGTKKNTYLRLVDRKENTVQIFWLIYLITVIFKQKCQTFDHLNMFGVWIVGLAKQEISRHHYKFRLINNDNNC